MNILVTGADGRIGRVVAESLAAAGHTVTATDIRQNFTGSLKLQLADLLDRAAVDALVAGQAAVIHFGNHASPSAIPDSQRLYLENTAMNLNVFDAGVQAGVRKVIFASSIQVIRGLYGTRPANAPTPPPLPLDGDTPPCPNNYYGLSKLNGEALLRMLAELHGFDAVALRLPLTQSSIASLVDFAHSGYDRGPADTAMAMLTAPEVARLVAAILDTDLPGYRCYMPALARHVLGTPATEIWHNLFAHFPLRDPARPLESFVDISRITRETGWSPAS